eukprot:126091_1
MPRKSNSSHMPHTDLTRVSSTFNNALRIIHSATTNKPSKIVVGDQSGTVTCFKWLKEIYITFQQTKDHPVTALTLDDDTIVIAYGQTIETIKKKGKVLSKFNLSLNEDVTSLQSRNDTIWCCGEYVYNCYKNQRDSHFFMSNDMINHIILIDLGLDELCPVLSCKDKAIRVLHGSELLHEIETNSNTTSLREIPCNEPNVADNAKQIIYGLENGSIGQIILNQKTVTKGWLLTDKHEGSVNCISSYDFTGDGYPEVIIGRDNGTIDVFEWKPGHKPYILASESLNESITSIDTGYVTGITKQDIVVATYSGRIIAYHCDPSRDFSAWEDPEMNRFAATGLASPLKQDMTRSNCDTMNTKIQQEIENYRRDIASKKCKYQEKSKELIAVNTQFHLKHSLKLLESEAAYLLTLEIGVPVDLVAIQSSVDMVSLDVDTYFGLQAQHKNIELIEKNRKKKNHNDIAIPNDADHNHCFVFHASEDNITRFRWKFRVSEGLQGLLTAFIACKRIPKTSQSCQFPIKALSLHSSVYQIEDAVMQERPMNVLQMNGDWTLRAFNSWLSQCIPDVPSRVSSNELNLSWKSIFVGDYITVNMRNGTAVFKSDSVTAIAILQEFLTKLAIENHVSISNVNINVDIQSLLHFFHLIQPKLEHHHKIHEMHSWIDALKEIESHEEDISCLSEDMQNILRNSEEIINEFKTSPKHLQFIKNMIWSNVHNFAKLRNTTVTTRNVEQLKRGLDT